MTIAMQPITLESVSIADPILMEAYNSGHSLQAELEFYVRLQPDGWFFVVDNGRPVGVGGVVNYGEFAYIGLVAVSPSVQRRGMGGMLMEHLISWLEERDCFSARLVATQSGEGLYRKIGFIEDDGTVSYRLEQQPERRPKGKRGGEEGNFILHDTDLDELVVFDTPIFGANRCVVLAAYLADLPGRCFATRDGNGRMTGYIMAQHDALGPWIARTPADAEALLLHSLTQSFEQAPSVRVYTSHSIAINLLKKHGFSERRVFKHMFYGNREPVRQREKLYALATAAIG
jgi:ribosomal protein S18 acetylase RimI-like enzyme